VSQQPSRTHRGTDRAVYATTREKGAQLLDAHLLQSSPARTASCGGGDESRRRAERSCRKKEGRPRVHAEVLIHLQGGKVENIIQGLEGVEKEGSSYRLEQNAEKEMSLNSRMDEQDEDLFGAFNAKKAGLEPKRAEARAPVAPQVSALGAAVLAWSCARPLPLGPGARAAEPRERRTPRRGTLSPSHSLTRPRAAWAVPRCSASRVLSSPSCSTEDSA
jgi:hypothetical protein